ncbi:MAG: VanW family protein [Oscillospiraceae bacterium]|nr:VanW family protein [Oscillospiraceae bacterium]
MKLMSRKSSHKSSHPRGRSKGRAVGAVIGIAAGIIILGAAGTGYYLMDRVDKLDTIYPGVTINGQDVSGLTREEAEAALSGTVAENLEAALTLPNGQVICITPSEVGIASGAKALAEEAMAYGRNGNPITNAITYYTAKGTLNLTEDIYANYDQQPLLNKVSAAVDAYNQLAGLPPMQQDGDTITLTKGAGITPLNGEEIANLLADGLKTAVESGKSWAYAMPAQQVQDINLDQLFESIHVDAVNAGYDKATGGVTPASEGITFDLDKAKADYAAASPGDSVIITLTHTEPTVTADNLEELLFRDNLHHCETTLVGSSSNRITNIRLAAEFVNGTILNPGEIFSYNDTVGERTYARGFREGISYIGGKSVPDVGGGICQVSSSLYCCAIHNNLNIVERANHMFLVSYLPLGIDATVAWGSCDFKFQNTMDYPIKIESYVSGSTLYINMYGTKTDDGYIEITHEVVGTYNYRVVEKTDNSLAPGTTKVDTPGHTGYSVDTYQNFYDGNGKLIRTEYLDRSDYSTQDRVILVGPAAASSSTSNSSSSSSSSGNNSGSNAGTPSDSDSGASSGGDSGASSGGDSGASSGGDSGASSGGDSGASSGGDSGASSGETDTPNE